MFRSIRRAALAAALPLIAASLLAVDAQAATSARSCTPNPYAYAGVIGTRNASGVKATITATKAAQVASGHVAGWIGVGGPGRGANGQDAWIQIGINSLPGSGNTIYAEAWIPGHGHAYKELGQVATGTKIDVALRELAGKPGWWQAFMDGKPVTKAIYLPGSHQAWEPMVITESWNGGRATCNGFTYKFNGVQQITPGRSSWQPLRAASTLVDRGYKVTNRTVAGFVAGSQS